MADWIPSRLGESWTLRLCATLIITVQRDSQSRDNPSPTPYSATVFGGRLSERFANDAAAKVAAIAFARMQIRRATAVLE